MKAIIVNILLLGMLHLQYFKYLRDSSSSGLKNRWVEKIFTSEQNRQNTYNVTSRCFSETTVAVGKQ